MNEQQINWFWAHRRNASLHHFSFLFKGLAGHGWQPTVNFWFDNQIIIGIPKKGCYVFYDKDQMETKYNDIQTSIDNNTNFNSDFLRKTDEIFGAIFFKCINIDLENLSLLNNKELLNLYKDFLNTIMVAPIITVQLWGIEACLTDDYKIIPFLKNRLKELGKEKSFEEYKGLLLVNTGETVAFTEQKNFYQIAKILYDNKEIRDLFSSHDAKKIIETISQFEYEHQLIKKHIEKFAWISTEYISEGWSKENWIELFIKAMNSDTNPEQKLKEILQGFTDLNQQRKDIIDELNPPEDVLHAIGALATFIAQRDWTKGYFTRILLSYNKLLNEISKKLSVKQEDLHNYSYLELENSLKNASPIDSNEILNRQDNGFALVIKHGSMNLYTGKEKITEVIREEGISEPFEKIINITEFKGLPASPGTIIAKARVIEDASKISQLQEGEILITYMTTIEFIPAFRKAAAVITDEGGMSCHAAIISREFKIPCIVGTKIATRVVQTGDTLEIDANRGLIKIVQETIKNSKEPSENYQTI